MQCTVQLVHGRWAPQYYSGHIVQVTSQPSLHVSPGKFQEMRVWRVKCSTQPHHSQHIAPDFTGCVLAHCTVVRPMHDVQQSTRIFFKLTPPHVTFYFETLYRWLRRGVYTSQAFFKNSNRFIGGFKNITSFQGERWVTSFGGICANGQPRFENERE